MIFINGCSSPKKPLDPLDFDSDIRYAFQDIKDLNKLIDIGKQEVILESLIKTDDGYEMSFLLNDSTVMKFYFNQNEVLSKIEYGNIQNTDDYDYTKFAGIARISVTTIFSQLLEEEDNFQKAEDFIGTCLPDDPTYLKIHEINKKDDRPTFLFKKDYQRQFIQVLIKQ